MTTENLWSQFKTRINSIIDKHIPTKLSKGYRKLPWVTDRIRKLIQKKNKLYSKWKKTGKTDTKSKLERLKKLVKKETHLAYSDYLNNLIAPAEDANGHTNKQKKFWAYMKSFGRDTAGIPPLKDRSTGTLVTDSKAKADILNQQYKSVFTEEDMSDVPLLDQAKHPAAPDLAVTTKGVEKLLSKIQPHKAAGPDNIPARFLKDYAAQLAPTLQIIFSKSLSSGILPSDWKTANVVPVFKKGNRHDASNYRPVSLTSICCKTLEHIIASHIMTHLTDHSILTDTQHGFRSGRSCESQLVGFVGEVAKSLDTNKQVDVAVLDFSKAFDRVPHQRLLSKARHYGISGNINNWLASFLIGREQRVLLDGSASSSVPVSSGVPQGTVLGPILFLIYINDLGQDINCQIRLFADDCILYKEIKSLEDTKTLQENLDTLTRWEDRWQMSFNVKKCHILTISRKRQNIVARYSLRGSQLDRVDSATYLGVEISNTLSWDLHIKKVTSKANRVLGMLRRNLKGAPPNTKALAYKSIVRPLLEYSSPVWDPHTENQKKQLESVQRRAARFVYNNYRMIPTPANQPLSPWTTNSVTHMLTTLTWKSLEQRREEARLTLFYKAVHGAVAIPVNQFLAPIVQYRNTRHSHPLQYIVPHTRTDAFRFSFFPNTARQWNALPVTLVQRPSWESFRSQVQAMPPWTISP